MRYCMKAAGEALHYPSLQMTNAGIIQALNYTIINTGCSRQEAIALVMVTMIETGISPRKALDAMFGEGTHQKLADDLWESLQLA